jgi:hypothetical protein
MEHVCFISNTIAEHAIILFSPAKTYNTKTPSDAEKYCIIDVFLVIIHSVILEFIWGFNN